jgi:hypothetical protein
VSPFYVLGPSMHIMGMLHAKYLSLFNFLLP